MNLIPKPKHDLFSDLQNEINTVFSRFTPSLWKDNISPSFWDNTTSLSPSIDVNETKDAVHVRAEIPGMEKDQISIDVQNNSLVLSGEKKHEAEKKDGNVHWKECSFGKFTRQIVLPSEVDSSKATAEYKNGVLNISLPKVENKNRKRIEVKVN
jgi:HSP20 family protein